MRRISLLSIILWMVISCVFDTTVRNISNLNFDFYVSFMVAASMELPADLFSIVGINWFGRRWSASLALIFCSLTMVVCAFVKGKTLRSCRGPEILSLRNILAFRILQVFVFLLGRFFATYAMNVGFQYTVEVMPTCLRGQGIALVNVMSMVSQMGSPYIVYSVRIAMHGDFTKLTSFQSVLSEEAPFLITSILCVLGSVPGLILPETAELKMPDTLEDVKMLGR